MTATITAIAPVSISLSQPDSHPDPRDLARLAVLSLQSPHSRRIYAAQIERFLVTGLPLSREGLQLHLGAVRATGVSAVSINHAASAVKMLAREAHARGQVTETELQSIESVKGAKRPGTVTGNWLELGALKALIAAAATVEAGVRNQAVIAVMAGCGLRREEVSTLRWMHWQQRSSRWVWLDITGKGNKRRTVPCPAWVAGYVNDWRELVPDSTAGQVFGGLGAQGIYYLVQDAAKRAGLPALAPHDLRRSYARLSREGGASIEQISATLGHSSITTTERYLGTRLELRDGMACGDHIKYDAEVTD